MPVIARFQGIVIKMYLRNMEHNPPHIHAIYGDEVGVFSLIDGEMYEGDLRQKEENAVYAFIIKNQEKLLQMWSSNQFEYIDI